MSPSPEELELGRKACRQVFFYEKYATKNARHVPWVLSCCGGLLAVFIARSDHPSGNKYALLFLFILLVYIIHLWRNQIAKVHHAIQKQFLKLLEEKYGDQLPWVVEEKQLAAAREVQMASIQASHP